MFPRSVYRGYEMSSLFIKRNIVYSHTMLEKNDTSNKESKLKGYAMSSYMKYMKHYEQMLEKRFPSAMHVYRIFSDGIKGFFQDLKAFFRVRYVLLGDEDRLSVLSRKEIELYDRMPKDMLKITPVLLLSTLPFANYVVFPIAYMYPQKFLTSHFWTPQQKQQIFTAEMKQRLQYNKIIMKCIKSRLSAFKDITLAEKWKDILKILEDGSHPPLEQILECKILFISGPYCIYNLHYVHINGLLRFHGLTPRLSWSPKLSHRAFILKEMDDAIVREGGVEPLSGETLENLCSIRGLNASNLEREEMVKWLKKWISLSNEVTGESYSLLLHAPFLIGCNHPNNKLLY